MCVSFTRKKTVHSATKALSKDLQNRPRQQTNNNTKSISIKKKNAMIKRARYITPTYVCNSLFCTGGDEELGLSAFSF